MKKIRIGVLGAYRGTSMINYSAAANNAEIVAICDKSNKALEIQKKAFPDKDITYYKDFDEFIKHDMDAVVLANYATEHAPFAIKAMKAGKHVFSEVLPVQTLKEAVELIECVEETGMSYVYGENYCYFPGTREMKKLYKEDKIGEFEYGECEYVHNCEPIWPDITYGEEDHWRNRMYANFYCTHSIGPIIHITGLRPVSVVGFESTMNERGLRSGRKGALVGMEIITLENGGIIKSLHGDLYNGNVWYFVSGAKGRMETSREIAVDGGIATIHVVSDKYSGEYPDNNIAEGQKRIEKYEPEILNKARSFGHGGSDYYTMYNFCEKLLGNKEADCIDVYEAVNMFLPGMLGYRSVLKGNVPVEIPDLRIKEERDKVRNNTACVDPKVAGDMLLPTTSKGTPEISQDVYDTVRETFKERMKNQEK